MNGMFNAENPFWSFISKLVDAMILGIIWIICCIPIVTIGPATTGVYYVTLKMVRNEEGYMFRSFWKSFRENFKQSLIMWLIYLVVGCFFAVDIYYYYTLNTSFGNLMMGLFIGLSALYLLSMLYVFALISKFSNTTKAMFQVSVLLPLRHFPTTALMILELVSSLLVVYVMPPMLMFMAGVYMFISSYHLRKIFDIYCEQIQERDAKQALAEEQEMRRAKEAEAVQEIEETQEAEDVAQEVEEPQEEEKESEVSEAEVDGPEEEENE